MTAIPLDEQPRESTLFNHLIDELDKCQVLKAKVEKAREAGPSSHRRSTEWLWKRVDIEIHQQKINRQEFDRALQAKPAALASNTTQKPNVPANSAKPDAPRKGDKPEKEMKEKKKKKESKGEDEAPATRAPNTTPKGQRVKVREVKAATKETPPLGRSRRKAPRT